MAGAFDDFVPPTKGGAFSDFTAPASPGATSNLGTTAIWNKPANVGWGDYMLAHLAQVLPNNPLDPHINANEALVAGSGLSGGLSGFIPGVRERTAQAEAEMDPQTRIALQGAGYIVGPGKLGLATKIAGRLAPLGSGALRTAAAGAAGAGAEGAASSALGTAGAGGDASDIGKAALIGGGGGALTGGILGGVRGPPTGPLASDLPPQSYFAGRTDAAAKDASNVLYDNADVRQTMMNARNEIGQQPARVTQKGAGALGAIGNVEMKSLGRGVTSAEDIKDALRDLYVDKTRDAVPNAGQIAQKHLNDMLQNTQPVSGGGVTPGPVGAGAAAVNRLNAAHGTEMDMERLAEMQLKAGRTGPDVGSQMKSYLATPDSANFSPQGTPTGDAFDALAATAKPTQANMTPSGFDIRHIVHPLVGAGIAGGLGVASERELNPQHLAAEMLIGAATGYGPHVIAPAIRARLDAGAQQRAFNAASATAATGQRFYPQEYLADPKFRNALRSLWFGQGAGGQF